MMLRFFMSLCIALLSSALYAQSIVTIDGSISYKEISDTTEYRRVAGDSYVAIKENEENYYIAIRSNNFTIANVYLLDEPDTITILHASFSLGSTQYKKKQAWQPTEESFFWELRDPSVTEEEGEVNMVERYLAFYKKNGWVANTAPQGSYRDMEFLISKERLTENTRVIVAYKRVEDRESKLSYWPSSVKLWTQSAELDDKIYNGYLPDDIEFNLAGFRSLSLNDSSKSE